MEEISKKQLTNDKLVVLKSSGTIGKKETKKEKVKQAFYKEKLGLKLNEDVVSEDSWTIQKIMDRTDKLVAEFMKDFEEKNS